MSISTALSNALTGLAAASRSAQVVSTNVSNATTEGFSRREIQLSARAIGGEGAGVQVDGIVRVVDDVVVRERRLAYATVGRSSEVAAFHNDLLAALGEPQEPSSLSARTAEFEGALLAATSRPESDARLTAVLNAAEALTGKLNYVSDRLQTIREDADRSIALEVSRLNTSLAQIADLNSQILRARGTDQDYPALLDSRQNLIDDISELIPIRQLPRDNDTVALYTMTGALLVDVTPAEFGFDGTAPITADMTLAGGSLSGLTVNGSSIATFGEFGQIAGGRLAGLFAVRDELAPAAQENIDEVARDLVARFEDPALDTTLAAGDPGLFTDRGSALDPLNITGLAARIRVNALVDPAQGGDVWRLRDGIGAAAPGAVGNASLLDALYTRLGEARAPVGGAFTSSARSAASFAADIVSITGQSLHQSEDQLSFDRARLTGLDDAMLANGVDTDQELQKLLLIEQAYAANAKVIQTADELIQLLIGL